MKYFTLIKGDSLHRAPGKKIVRKEEFSSLVDAATIITKVKEEAEHYRHQVALECETLKEEAIQDGFTEGLQKWNERLFDMEKHIENVKTEMNNSVVPLIMAAVKKIVGREIEVKHETIAEIIGTSLKTVSHHKRITLYVNKNDLEILEEKKSHLKSVFEHLQSFNIAARDDVPEGGCVVETESGIINVGLQQQLQALEVAFTTLFQKGAP